MAEKFPAAKNTDLGVRVMSAAVMLLVAGVAIWFRGWIFNVFVVVVGMAVMFEWQSLVNKFTHSIVSRLIWAFGGAIYIALAIYALVYIAGDSQDGMIGLLVWIGMVVATDIGAYFSGRTFGGPKIAPRISPSKTWSGLLGGMAGAVMVASIPFLFATPGEVSAEKMASINWAIPLLTGGVVAILAQSGDFFESWMKRRAGVKDSGRLIPGHGGVFDRVDGLLAVMSVGGVLSISEVWRIL